jgi:undecaprenyl diphosphate synthase
VPSSADLEVSGLDHVVLAGGTPAEWLKMTQAQWANRLHDLAKGAEVEGAHWITLLPHHGDEFSAEERQQFSQRLLSVNGVSEVTDSFTHRLVWNSPSGSHVIIDSSPDGHRRFAATVEALRVSGTTPEELSEDMLSRALLRPAETEADLVLILGSPDRIPDSMVWELAYSELVFIDIDWEQLNASHLELAIDDFNRRHRRFGGLDS